MPRIEADRICLLRTSAIGDIVHAMVLAAGLRSGYPGAHITWVTQDIPGSLVAGNPSIDRLITFKRCMTWRGWLQFRRRLKEDRYDLLIVPQVSAKAGILAWWIRSKIKLGFDLKRARELSWLVTNRKIPHQEPGHVLDQFMEFLDYLEIGHGRPEWNFHITDTEIEWRNGWRAQFTRPLCALVPASSNPEKDWKVERFAELADRVSAELNLQPVIVCGPGGRETAMAQAIQNLTHCKPPVASEKPLRNTLLQLSSARIVVAPDTGPLHLAVASGIPVVGLYGYSNPRRCGPYFFRDLVIDRFNDDPEQPEPITHRTKPGRMDSITVAEVMERIYLELSRP